MYKIADLIVDIKNPGSITKIRAEKYLTDVSAMPDITISVTDEEIRKMETLHPELGYDDWDYMLVGAEFYTKLLGFDGILLHASAVVVNQYAYLFSAACGTGKSTHTNLWLKHFGDRAYILNDDKPAIRRIDGEFFAYGTPFSGKFDMSADKKIKLAGIAFIEQSPLNYIKPMQTTTALYNLFGQTVRKVSGQNMDKLMTFIDSLLRHIPVYQFGCNISDDAVKTSYNVMRKDK